MCPHFLSASLNDRRNTGILLQFRSIFITLSITSLFNVSAQQNNNSFSVTLSLPEKIKEKMFNSVWVVVGDQDDPLFALPTTVVKEEGKTKAWFIAKPIDGYEYVFIFSYGKGCGIAIEVPVEFKEKT